MSTARVLPLGSPQKATLVAISLVMADHVDTLKSNNPTDFRSGYQLQSKEKTPDLSFLPQ
jgi:hypothetical protein